MQLGDLAGRASVVGDRGNGRVDARGAHSRLLTRALLRHDRGTSLAAYATGTFVDSLNSRQEFCINWLHARPVDSLNGALNLALIDLFKHI